MTSESLGTAKDKVSSSFKSNSTGLNLDEIYPKRNISDILTINRKIFEKNLTEKLISLHPFMSHLKLINIDFTKLRYYENDDYYKPHQDLARFTASSYFFKEPKVFTGGDLHFPEFNYTITIENNMLVFFVGSILHSSTPLKIKNKDNLNKGYGKYVMTQFLDAIEKI